MVCHGVNRLCLKLLLLGAGPAAPQCGSSFRYRGGTHSGEGALYAALTHGVYRMMGIHGLTRITFQRGHLSWGTWGRSVMSIAPEPHPVMLMILLVSTGCRACLYGSLMFPETDVIRSTVEQKSQYSHTGDPHQGIHANF